MINLQKGQSINLSKQPVIESKGTNGLSAINFGLDWGMIESSGFFGLGKSKESVDLDASAVIVNNDGTISEIVYYGYKMSNNGNIRHLGDDRGGDEFDDGKDNEIIVCNLAKLYNSKAVVFILNSFSGQNFGDLPYVRIRSFLGSVNTKPSENEILGTLELSKDPSMKNKKAMIMGAAIFENNEWKFKAIGEASNNNNVKELAKESLKYI